MREVEGWAAMDYPSVCLTTPQSSTFSPPYLCKYELQYNQYI
jgi:hypothetical protein